MKTTKLYLFNVTGVTYLSTKKTTLNAPPSFVMKAARTNDPIKVQVSNVLTPGDVLCSIGGKHYRLITITSIPLPEGYFRSQLAAGDASATTNTISA